MKENKMPYYLSQFIYEIAYSAYGVTFFEVLVSTIQDFQNLAGSRGILEIESADIKEFKEQIPKYRFMLGTSEQQIKEVLKLGAEVKKANEKFFKGKATKKQNEEYLKKIAGMQEGQAKEQVSKNYGIYPVNFAFEAYNAIIREKRSKGDKLFEDLAYNITQSVQQRFFLDLEADKLSTAVSPDWAKPLDENGNYDGSKFWKYIQDPAVRLPSNVVPYRGYRAGYKLFVVPKKEFEEYFKKPDFKKLCSGKLINANNTIVTTQAEVETTLNVWLNSFTTTENGVTISDNNVCVWLKFTFNRISQVPIIDMITAISGAGPVFDANLSINFAYPTITNYYPGNVENEPIILPPKYPEEQMNNLLTEMEEFANDYKKFEVKKIADSVNMKINDKAFEHLYKSTNFALDLVNLQFDTIQKKWGEFQKYMKYVEKFKAIMNKDKFY